MFRIFRLTQVALQHPIVAARGAYEFRRTFTRHYEYPRDESYDAGCELAHIVTLRHWDQ